MSKNEQARKNFIEWFFGNNDFSPDHNKVNIIPPDELPLSYRDIITTMMEEIIKDGVSVWTFEDLVESADGPPDHILQELKYADRIDDEMLSEHVKVLHQQVRCLKNK